MINNTIDEENVFRINKDCSISYEEIGPTKIKCVTVDNFYENPDLVRDLALIIPASKNKRIRGNNPAERVNAFYVLDDMAWIYDKLIRQYWPEIADNIHPDGIFESFRRATFMVNIMQSTNLPNVAPHQDNTSGVNWASTIYLNKDNECAGGTSFYTFNGQDNISSNSLNKHGKPLDRYITDSVGDWELVGIAPMKYNRMVLYNQSILHTAYVKPEMFTGDLYRINQQFFI